MLDPREQAKNGFRAAEDRLADRLADRAADRAADHTTEASREGPAVPPSPSMDALYERFDTLAHGHHADDGSALHAAILARLMRNRQHAEEAGWTSFTLERDAETGSIRLVGLAPSAAQRTIVPDWTTRVAEDAAVRRVAGSHPGATPSGEEPGTPRYR